MGRAALGVLLTQHFPVGLHQSPGKRHVRAFHAGAAEGQKQGHGVGRAVVLLKGALKLEQDFQGGFFGAAWEQNGEFVAAHAGDAVRGPQGAAQQQGRRR